MSVGSDNMVMIEGLGRLDDDERLEADEDEDEVGDLQGGGGILLGNLPNFDADRSVATTQLATEVGSMMGVSKTPFLKSFTIQRRKTVSPTENAAPSADNVEEPDTVEIDWGSLEFKDVKVKRKNRVMVQNLRGLIAQDYSGIKEGDYVHSIDLEPVSSSSSDAESVQNKLAQPTELPYFCLATTFPTGNDVWVQATIIKPDRDMTLEEMGMTVWFWGYVSVTLAVSRVADSLSAFSPRSFVFFFHFSFASR